MRMGIGNSVFFLRIGNDAAKNTNNKKCKSRRFFHMEKQSATKGYKSAENKNATFRLHSYDLI